MPSTLESKSAVSDKAPVSGKYSGSVTVLEPRRGLRFINWKELFEYRDLFIFLTWRTIKVRYAQSAIGIGWAVIQPVVEMIVYTIIFGGLAKVDSDGVPYAIFTFAAIVPWTYFSGSVTDGTSSLVGSMNLISKVYFPRAILPLSAVLAKLLDFGIAFVVLCLLMAWYRQVPNWNVLALPFLVALMVLTSAGIGMWLTALAIQYRDIKHAMPHVIRLLMYAAPVVYPASLVPEKWQYVYALNPMVGVIEGFRASMLGTRPMPWDLIAIGTCTSLVVAITGAMYFRNKERMFADVV